MPDAGGSLGTTGIIELVSGVFLLNIGVMAVAFGVASGAALLLSRPDLAGVFAAAAGFLALLAAVLGVFRSMLVGLLERLVS